MKRALVVSLFLSLSFNLFSQEINQEKPQKLRYYLTSDKSSFVGIKASAQVWARYTEMNPGTMIGGEPQTTSFDFSLRRVRLGVYGQLASRWSFEIQMGENNFNNLTNYSKSLRVLDAHISYKVADFITLGAGKSGWTGLARCTVPSSANALEVDIPMFSLATVNISDDILRKMGVFGFGSWAHWSYRFAVVKPFTVTSSSALELSPEGYTNFSDRDPRLQTSGYASYNFLDAENTGSPFNRGTYLGTKRILNLGVGFMHQPEAMAYLDAEGETNYTDMTHFAADLFLDMPLCKRNCSAITLYAAYFIYDFGNGYIRNIGANNPGQALGEEASFNGKGNAFPAIGTGRVGYVKMGYALPERKTSSHTTSRYQLYAAVQHADYERLGTPMNLYEGGVNYYINQYTKFTLGYQNRPVFDIVAGNKPEEVDRKGMWVVQWQIKVF